MGLGMARKNEFMANKKVGSISTGTAVLLGLGGLGVVLLLSKKSTPPPTIIRTVTPVNSSSATTAAAITAGAGVLNNVFDDLFGDN